MEYPHLRALEPWSWRCHLPGPLCPGWPVSEHPDPTSRRRADPVPVHRASHTQEGEQEVSHRRVSASYPVAHPRERTTRHPLLRSVLWAKGLGAGALPRATGPTTGTEARASGLADLSRTVGYPTGNKMSNLRRHLGKCPSGTSPRCPARNQYGTKTPRTPTAR